MNVSLKSRMMPLGTKICAEAAAEPLSPMSDAGQSVPIGRQLHPKNAHTHSENPLLLLPQHPLRLLI
jgi:hypothetical protein